MSFQLAGPACACSHRNGWCMPDSPQQPARHEIFEPGNQTRQWKRCHLQLIFPALEPPFIGISHRDYRIHSIMVGNSGPRTVSVHSVHSVHSVPDAGSSAAMSTSCDHVPVPKMIRLELSSLITWWPMISPHFSLKNGHLGVPGLVATFTVCELENHHVLLVNQLFLWPCSIAMLVYQRVYPIRHRILKIRGRLNPCCGAKRQSAEKALTQSSHGRVWWSHSSSEKSAHWKSQKSHWAGVQTLVLRQNQGTWECISHEKILQKGFSSWMSCLRQKQLLPKWSQFMNRSHTTSWFQSWSIWNGLSMFIISPLSPHDIPIVLAGREGIQHSHQSHATL